MASGKLMVPRVVATCKPIFPVIPCGPARLIPMGRLFGFVGSTILGYIGWFLGARIGITTAVILSIVGTGLGIYYGRKVAQYYS